ncbi:YciI family protein [Nitrospirillum pindoramense]|uniref:Uncharacterized protein YciI n=1 Tax=Nitrospirillum amazonense TaxID=28077 RepID=A0A560HBN7_9PROT|nr:YciI family protein [Nitrospirillum amazonense]TWB43778.1 uncharacterized protein YciI [Nitrospirillum amazonense]
MIYAVTLTYRRPVEDINPHLDTHRDWLVALGHAGHLIAAGPLEDGSGGVVLLHCRDQEEVADLLSRDSFHVHRLVDYDTRAFLPKLRADDFPERWAVGAKPIASRP